MRLHIGFFGITRSLRFTVGSIRDKVVGPARQAGAQLLLSGHFHLPDAITNARSGEAGLRPDPEEAALLQLDRCLVELQDPDLVADRFLACQAYPDHFQDGYASLRNLCFQLRSLERLWALMAPHVGDADWVLFLRPDLFYLDAFPVTATVAAMDEGAYEMAVPRWHCWGGLNDRFALCNAYAAEAYATRGKHLAASAAETVGLHPESLLAYAARQAELRVAPLDLRAVRIRADGSAVTRDMAEFGLAGAEDLLAA